MTSVVQVLSSVRLAGLTRLAVSRPQLGQVSVAKSQPRKVGHFSAAIDNNRLTRLSLGHGFAPCVVGSKRSKNRLIEPSQGCVTLRRSQVRVSMAVKIAVGQGQQRFEPNRQAHLLG